jgi:hypothetical protein
VGCIECNILCEAIAREPPYALTLSIHGADGQAVASMSADSNQKRAAAAALRVSNQDTGNSSSRPGPIPGAGSCWEAGRGHKRSATDRERLRESSTSSQLHRAEHQVNPEHSDTSLAAGTAYNLIPSC